MEYVGIWWSYPVEFLLLFSGGEFKRFLQFGHAKAFLKNWDILFTNYVTISLKPSFFWDVTLRTLHLVTYVTEQSD